MAARFLREALNNCAKVSFAYKHIGGGHLIQIYVAVRMTITSKPTQLKDSLVT